MHVFEADGELATLVISPLKSLSPVFLPSRLESSLRNTKLFTIRELLEMSFYQRDMHEMEEKQDLDSRIQELKDTIEANHATVRQLNPKREK